MEEYQKFDKEINEKILKTGIRPIPREHIWMPSTGHKSLKEDDSQNNTNKLFHFIKDSNFHFWLWLSPYLYLNGYCLLEICFLYWLTFSYINMPLLLYIYFFSMTTHIKFSVLQNFQSSTIVRKHWVPQ